MAASIACAMVHGDRRWGDAVIRYMSHVGTVVDVYPSMTHYEADDVTLAALELQFTPLFQD